MYFRGCENFIYVISESFPNDNSNVESDRIIVNDEEKVVKVNKQTNSN